MAQAQAAAELGHAVRAAAEVLRLGELDAEVLPRLRRAVGASGVLLYRYGEGGALRALGGTLAPAMGAYRSDLFAADPLQRPPRALPPGAKLVLVSQAIDPGEFHASAAYQEFYRPHDLEHVACLWITGDTGYGRPGMAGVLFGRTRGEGAFGPRECEVLRAALPSLAAAARRDLRLEALERTSDAKDALFSAEQARPLLALDARGGLLWLTASAEALLFAGLPRAQRRLPEALREAARGLGELARTGELRTPPSFCVPLRCGGAQHRAVLSLRRAPSGEPVVAVELERERPSLEGFAHGRGLTVAETQVLRGLCDGLTNAELAARLFVGVETVRTHVRRVLAKLETHTRGRAVALVREEVGRS
jgi:DNA-binding CsgD family transcriptional regulator